MADLARCLVFDDEDDDCGVELLVAEWDRDGSLGVEMGESGGGVGKIWNSVRCAGVFFCCCGRGIIWAVRCCFCYGIVFGGMFGFFNCFSPSPSVIESLHCPFFSLDLLRYPFPHSVHLFHLFFPLFFSLFL